jgi:uncharacterized membrane protein AbrB (regulator of aidB expression)
MTAIASKFFDLIERSVIVQALITLALIIVLCILWATGQTPPDRLIDLTFAVVGFWFGSKVENAKLQRLIKKG